jgi:tetratricopeptide (TPR) repeat protein
MSEETSLGSILRSNWHLLVVLTLIVGGAAALALRPEPSPTADAASVPVQMEVRTTLQSQTMPGAAATERSKWAKPTREEKTDEAIENYEHEINYNPGSTDNSHNLFRLGNLYFTEKQDYDKASTYYLALVQDYPDYPANQTVYPNLVKCYEQLGKPELKKNILQRMKAHFEEGSEPWLFAQQELDKM